MPFLSHFMGILYQEENYNIWESLDVLQEQELYSCKALSLQKVSLNKSTSRKLVKMKFFVITVNRFSKSRTENIKSKAFRKYVRWQIFLSQRSPLFCLRNIYFLTTYSNGPVQ